MNTIEITFVRGVKTLVYAKSIIRGVEIQFSTSSKYYPFENKLLTISDVMQRVAALNKDFGPFKIVRGY